MTRTMLVVMGALLGSGCAARTLREETQPVGATCSRTTIGMITGTYVCLSTPPGRLNAVYEFRPENGMLHVALCNAGGIASGISGEFHFDIREPMLGTHILDEGGTAEVEGYDPTRGVVCGTFDTHHQRGTFVAVRP